MNTLVKGIKDKLLQMFLEKNVSIIIIQLYIIHYTIIQVDTFKMYGTCPKSINLYIPYLLFALCQK